MQRGERQLHLRLHARRAQHRDVRRRLDRVLEQRRLPDARLPPQDQHAARPARARRAARSAPRARLADRAASGPRQRTEHRPWAPLCAVERRRQPDKNAVSPSGNRSCRCRGPALGSFDESPCKGTRRVDERHHPECPARRKPRAGASSVCVICRRAVAEHDRVMDIHGLTVHVGCRGPPAPARPARDAASPRP